MSARTEEQIALFIQERCIILIYSNYIRLRLLSGKLNVVLARKPALILLLYLFKERLKALYVLRRHSHYHIHHTTLILCIKCSLHQMLLKGSSVAIGILMKLNKSLWLLAIPKRLFVQGKPKQMSSIHKWKLCRILHKPLCCRALLKRLALGKQLLCFKQILKHSGGCSRCRHKFAALPLKSVQPCNSLYPLLFGEYFYSRCRCCGICNLQIWEPCEIILQLSLKLLRGNTPLLQLFKNRLTYHIAKL